jgi:hypothetical protein
MAKGDGKIIITEQKKRDEQELRKAVRAFNEKRRRILKKDPEASSFLPEVRSLREERKALFVETAAQRKTRIADIRRFGEKGAEAVVTNKKGLSATKYEIELLQEQTRRRNIVAAHKRKNLPPGYKRGIDDPSVEGGTRKIKFDFDDMDKRQFNAKKKRLNNSFGGGRTLSNNRRDEQYKKNYMKAARSQLGKWGKRLARMINLIPAARMVELAKNNQFLTIPFEYAAFDPQEKYEIIIREWRLHVTMVEPDWSVKESEKYWAEHVGDMGEEEEA